MTPEDDSTATIESHTLQYYLNDSLKYFTSNTQLQFLAGHYYNKLVVKNVTNFSLVGSHTTVIYSQHATIKIYFAENITISNIICINKHSTEVTLLLLKYCSNVFIQGSIFTCHSKDCDLTIANAFKTVILRNVSSDYLTIWHARSISDCNITVSKYTGQNTENKTFAITIELYQHNYNINILLSQIKVKLDKAISLTSETCTGTNHIKLEKTTFTGVLLTNKIMVYVELINCGVNLDNQLANIIHFDECHFTEIKSIEMLFRINVDQKKFLSDYSIVSFTNCVFYKINSRKILYAFLLQDKVNTWKPRLIINIQSATLSRLTIMDVVLEVKSADLVLLGPVIFTEIRCYCLISGDKDSQIYLHYYVELSLNEVTNFFYTKYIILKENSKLNIINNNVFLFF